MSKKQKLINNNYNKVEDFLGLPYTYTVGVDYDSDSEPYFYAQVNELSGCISDGKTIEEALKNAKDAMHDWIETALINNDTVPIPDQYSGKFTVRIPPSLHRDLIIKSNQEGTSINQFVTSAIARAVGF